MKKWIALILAAVMLLSCLAGCAKDATSNGDDNTSTGDSKKPNKDKDKDKDKDKNNKDEEEIPTGFGYKVEYLDFELDENIIYIQNSLVSGETLFFIASYKVGTETSSYFDENGNEVSYEYDLQENRLFRMNMDGTGVQMITDYVPMKPEEGQEGYSYIEKMYPDGEGGLWVVEQRSVTIFELPEDFDPETQNQWDFWVGDEMSIAVMRFDAAGAKVSERTISQPEGVYLYNYMLDSAGNLYATDGMVIYGYDESGKEILKIESEEYLELMQISTDLIYASMWKEDGRVMKKVDLQTKTLGEEMTLEGTAGNAWQFYPGFDNYQFLFNYNGRVFGYIEETKTSEQVLDWLDCDINSNNVQSFSFLPDGRVVAWEQEYVENSNRPKYSLDLLTRVPKSELPREEEITLACMYLDWEMRTQIVNFNKRNEGVRIVVKDYSEFNTEDDYNAGLTKLTTEILSGKVPDILDTDGMPIAQYGGKGILMDLWQLIDQDPELSREDLMSEVFDAMSIDGKLYYITDTFSIQSAVGNSRLVGDEIGWTLADLLDAKSMLPPEATIFGEGDTKAGMLEQCLYLNLDSFIDWQTMRCDFESQEFIDLLKFANSFPLEFNWEDYDYSVYESEFTRLKTGKQMLARAGIYGLETYMYYCAMFENNATFVGFPSATGKGNVFNVNGGLAISSSCEHMDLAWSFVREMLLEENQTSEYIWDFPTNRKVFDKMVEQWMTPRYWTDPETGEQVEQPMTSYWLDENTTIEITHMTQEQYDGFMELYRSCKTVRGYNEKIAQIIREETEMYFNGQKPVEETARMIQSRVGLYLAEQG